MGESSRGVGMNVVATSKPAPRWSVLAPVVPRNATERPDWRAVNISETGMFVSGAPLLQPGSVFDVDIVLPGAYGPSLEITSRVQVVWSRGPADASRNRPTGMGMRFVDIQAPMQAELNAYLEELSNHQTNTQPQWSMVAVETPPPLKAVASPAVLLPSTKVVTEKAVAVPVVLQTRPIVAPLPGATPPPPPPATAPIAARPPPPPPVALPRVIKKGDTLGRYTIVDRIGSGGMGDVFLAQHTTLGRKVALKLLQEQHVHDRAALRRFYDEARLVNQISHDNIVEITDLVVGDDHTFIVMELLQGHTLSDELGRGGPMPLSRIKVIGDQLCGALDAVHRAGIVHRDLKPQNIMLIARGKNPDFVKLLDFGIAKLRQDAVFDGTQTKAGEVVGTPGFIAPEHLLGEPVDSRSDIYSLGVILYAMVTGQMPFQAASWAEMMMAQVTRSPRPPSAAVGSAIPKPLENIIMRCLDKNPNNRPANAMSIATVLMHLKV